MTSRITNRWLCACAGLVVTASVALAELPQNLDDDYWSENKSTRLHGKSAGSAVDEAKKKLALTTPVAGDPKALDARDTDLLKRMSGQVVTVQGTVLTVFHSDKSDTRFFNLTKDRNGFSFVIFARAVSDFAPVGEPLDFYRGKKVQVTGVMTVHQERPSMVVSKPDQISLVR